MWIMWRMRLWSWMWFKQGQIEGECGIGSDCGNVECGNKGGDSHAEETSPAAIPLPPLPPSPHPIPNQSKPIVQSLSHSHLL